MGPVALSLSGANAATAGTIMPRRVTVSHIVRRDPGLPHRGAPAIRDGRSVCGIPHSQPGL